MTANLPSKSTKSKVPKLRLHKASGQAWAVFNNRPVYFGRYDEPESAQKYHLFVAEWLTAGKMDTAPSDEITVAELIARFWTHAQGYYVHADGTLTHEPTNIRLAMRPLNELYGHIKAAQFGPRALCTVRQKMIEQGICRDSVNKRIGRIKLMFKWAAAHELVPGSVFHALQAVPGLRHGRSAAKETEPVKPVPQEYIDAIEPYVSKQVWALIQLQLLTAARSGELVIMRPCDIDTSGKIWIYRLAQHKTAHHGHDRTIYVGPRGQEVLRPFLLRPANSYCFSPAESMAQHRLERSQKRTTPQKYGNRPGTNKKESYQRQPGEHYTPTGYGHTVAKAIKKAFRPEDMSDKEFKKWKSPQHWHPHQLRHNAATFLRKEFGLETARIILGHRSAAITEVYAELDQQKALEAVVKVG